MDERAYDERRLPSALLYDVDAYTPDNVQRVLRDYEHLQEEPRQKVRWRFSGLAALAGLAAIPTYNMYKQYSETRKAKQIESHVHREAVPTVRQLQIT